jgi:hypothetical protein
MEDMDRKERIKLMFQGLEILRNNSAVLHDEVELPSLKTESLKLVAIFEAGSHILQGISEALGIKEDAPEKSADL